MRTSVASESFGAIAGEPASAQVERWLSLRTHAWACGRSFEEVQLWTEMSAGEKRAVWHRITQAGTSWRFNKYAERAAEDRQLARAAAEAQKTLPL